MLHTDPRQQIKVECDCGEAFFAVRSTAISRDLENRPIVRIRVQRCECCDDQTFMDRIAWENERYKDGD